MCARSILDSKRLPRFVALRGSVRRCPWSRMGELIAAIKTIPTNR